MANSVWGGLGCLLLGGYLIYRNEKSRQHTVAQVPQRQPVAALGPVQETAGPIPAPPPDNAHKKTPHFVCWFCSDKSVAPTGLSYGYHTTTCPKCETDNEIKAQHLNLEAGEMYQGNMPLEKKTRNRIKKYL